MPRPRNITVETMREVVKQLEAEGIAVSTRSIRERYGFGGYGSITPVLAEVRRLLVQGPERFKACEWAGHVIDRATGALWQTAPDPPSMKKMPKDLVSRFRVPTVREAFLLLNHSAVEAGLVAVFNPVGFAIAPKAVLVCTAGVSKGTKGAAPVERLMYVDPVSGEVLSAQRLGPREELTLKLVPNYESV